MARRKTSTAPSPPASSQPAPGAAEASALPDAAAPAPFGPPEVAALVDAGGLDVAAGLILAALDRRTGDPEVAAAAAVLRAQQAALAGLPPLHDAPRRMPRADERGVAAFTELLALLRLQEGQLAEMQAALAELT